MSTVTRRATLDDLMRFDGKAELINGEVVELMGSGIRPIKVAARIYRSLDDHAILTGVGEAFTDGLGCAVTELPSGRESFTPDVSYFARPMPLNSMRFADGAPDFAAEVRSEHDYGPAAERAMADKRADYFAAGTKVVWDVDPEAGVIRVYRPADPRTPTVFAPGQDADAEPAVPGWRVATGWVLGAPDPPT